MMESTQLNSVTGSMAEPIENDPVCDLSGLADDELLGMFLRTNEPTPFALLVQRHHGMIFGIAKRMLGCSHTAEDVVQATFLVLAKDSRKIRKRHSIVSWLYGVAFRISARTARQQAKTTVSTLEDKAMVTADPLEELNARFEQGMVFEELHNLPESLKAPLVLRYLKGNSNLQVANQLEISESAVEGRLKRGRTQLRLRLTRKGVTFGLAIGVLGLVQRDAAATELSHLVASTVATAVGNQAVLSANASPVETAVNSNAMRMAEQEILKMATTKAIGLVAATSILVGVVASGWALAGDSPRQGSDSLESNVAINNLGSVQEEAANVALTQAENEEILATGGLGDGFSSSSGQEGAEPSAPSASTSSIAGDASIQQRQKDIGHFSINDMSENEIRIYEKLREPYSFEFSETPMSEVIESLSQENQLQIMVDQLALLDEGLELETEPVTLNVQNVRLENGLRMILDRLNLTAIVRNEVLLITTKDVAEWSVTTRVYPVSGDWGVDSLDLREAIMQNVSKESWEENGGTYGTISNVPEALVITASHEVHGQINDLLGQLDRLYRTNSER